MESPGSWHELAIRSLWKLLWKLLGKLLEGTYIKVL
jgi:hypothetical protein